MVADVLIFDQLSHSLEITAPSTEARRSRSALSTSRLITSLHPIPSSTFVPSGGLPSIPPTTTCPTYIGSKTSARSAPCSPRADQLAILSEQDMQMLGTESARPGFVRIAPKFS